MKLGDLLRGENPPAGFRGKDWIKLDLHQISAGSSDASGNPGNLLGTLRGAAHVKRVGTEEIHGVETTHFKANIDTRLAVSKIKDRKLRKLAEKSWALMGDSLPVNVWIDDDGLTRRMQLEFSAKGTSFDEVLDFVDFGVDAFIVAPPKSSTIDFKELISRSGGDLGSI